MNIVITGSDGRIGSVLRRGLGDLRLTGLDRSTRGVDLFDPAAAEIFRGHDAVIHLAWIDPVGPPLPSHTYRDALPADNRHLRNLELNSAVLHAAHAAGVKRAILASSVHADAFRDWPGPTLLSAERVPRAVGPYGAAKLLLEEQGRHFASLGIDVTCVRFGAVTADGDPDPEDPWERRVWLSCRDCVGAIRACLDAPPEPGRFCVFYAVSNNEGIVHDTRNPFGWRPLDGADATARPGPGTERCTVRFSRMQDGTAEDFLLARACALRLNRGLADRLLALLRALAHTPTAYRIDRMQHALQTATRALRDGADEETVVCALFHDIATWLCTENHAAVAAEILRPFISPENWWMLTYHGDFQTRHRSDLPDEVRNARDRHLGHPGYERTARFADCWDQAAFDPGYDTLPLEAFEPMVRRVLARTRVERMREAGDVGTD